VGPFDGSDDTLVGIVNNSTSAVDAVTVSGPGSGLSLFDGDGICSGDYGAWDGSAGCPYGPTGYEGPGTSYVTSQSLPDSAEVDFTGGLTPGQTTYFSLEGALVAAQVTAREGGLSANGSIPVQPNSTQDTHATYPQTKCNAGKFVGSVYIGQLAALYIRLHNAPVAAGLLEHFLQGTGSEVDFQTGTKISKELGNGPEFKALNGSVQSAIDAQLDSGNTQIQLTQPTLSLVRLTSTHELYYGFRGTQGLDVSGSGQVTNGNWVGSITYVIKDSYGFPPGYSFLDAGPAMRYLQINCGNPPFDGGAHWFPDTITVTVPFSHPVSTLTPKRTVIPDSR
jgi:hypothetical protein